MEVETTVESCSLSTWSLVQRGVFQLSDWIRRVLDITIIEKEKPKPPMCSQKVGDKPRLDPKISVAVCSSSRS